MKKRTEIQLNTNRAQNLSSIGNKTARNIIRGVIAAENPSVSSRAMVRLRNEANTSDVTAAYDFLINSTMAKHVPLAPLFPNQIEDCISSPYLGDENFLAELAAQKARFRSSEMELLRAIASVEMFNDRVFAHDTSGLSGIVEKHIDDFGISLLVMRKALSIRHSQFGPNLSSAVEPLMSQRRHLITVAFEDSIDKDLSYIRVRRTFLSHVENGRASKAVRPLLLDLMSPSSIQVKDSLSPLEAYSRWGVLDSLAFLERVLSDKHVVMDAGLATLVRDVIPDSVHNAWLGAFGKLAISNVAELLGGENSFHEYRLFRHSPAWAEIPAVWNYRKEIEDSVGHRLDGKFNDKYDDQRIVPSAISKAAELLPTGDAIQTPRLPIDPKKCGVFHRSLAVAGLLDSGANLYVSDGAELLNLLDKTMDISMLVSTSELSKLLPKRTDDRIYEYLRTALQFDAEAGRVTDHAFRRATQNLVSLDFAGSVLEFAKYLDQDSPNVSEHFFATCNEYFLTELYLLFENSDAVIDAQADLLEWYGQTRKDEDAVTRAKSHRLNLRLRKVRGSIDDTRIYVDPLKFQYWAIDEIAAQLRDIANSSDLLLIHANSYPSLSDPIAAVEDPRTKLFQVLNLAYKEFCTNEFYGVDSYIGRRIRHGTLDGVLVAELKEPAESVYKDFQHLAPDFAKFIKCWHENVELIVKKFGRDVLRVKSNDHKNGLIVPSIADGDKRDIALSMLNEVAKTLGTDRSVGVAISYVYDFCWLLLEIDLKRLRAAALSAQQELVIRPQQHVSGLNGSVDGQILDAVRYLNTELQQRFEKLLGWLTRPSNTSPSATLSLLFNAVIHEVQGRYHGFHPKTVEVGETEIDMFGHRFHTFYDALFVLVDNAAKHGNREGELRFEVRMFRGLNAKSEIRLTVTSQLKNGTEDSDKNAIMAAMQSDLGSAMLDNTNSGIRKIRVLVDNVEELTDFSVGFTPTAVSFSLAINLTLAGTDIRPAGVI